MNDEIPTIHWGEESEGDMSAIFQNIIADALAEEGIQLSPEQLREVARGAVTGITQFLEEVDEDDETE